VSASTGSGHSRRDGSRPHPDGNVQYLRQLAPGIGLPLSSYLADILGFDPEQVIKRLPAVRSR
jgi:hypothetical protein